MARHRIVKGIARTLNKFYTAAETCFWWLFSLHYLRPHYIRRVWGTENPAMLFGKVAIFIHYDRHGRIHDYVFYYMAALRDAGYQVIFVSNAPKIDETDVPKVLRIAVCFLWRRNIGYDFGAAKDGIRFLGDLTRFEQVIVCNDSVYGPLFSLAPLLERIDPDQAQIWGMTDCWITSHHVQSYFVVYTKEALRSPAFGKFWRGVRYIPSKRVVVRLYEIGQSAVMRRGGLRCAALMPYSLATTALVQAVRNGALEMEELDPLRRDYIARVFSAVEAGAPLNPTHYFWDHLISSLGFPFIKIELLARNPGLVVNVSLWREVVRQAADYDTDLIARHLESIMRGRAA